MNGRNGIGANEKRGRLGANCAEAAPYISLCVPRFEVCRPLLGRLQGSQELQQRIVIRPVQRPVPDGGGFALAAVNADRFIQ